MPALHDFGAGEQVFLPAVAAEGDDVRVFEEQKMVGDPALLAGRDQLLLQFERRAVGDASEFPHLALTH